MSTLRDCKMEFEKRFHRKWTFFSVEYHFKAIMSFLLNLRFEEINLHLDSIFPEEKNKVYEGMLLRLDNDEPLQYVLGETEFRNCKILCSKAALIPRPETEELVELIVNMLADLPAPRILDLCTGTGCIAIALNVEFKTAELHGIDKFEEVIQLAQKNNQLNATRVQFTKNDVLNTNDMRVFLDGGFDAWVANPPYIPNLERAGMGKNVIDFEPSAALFVDDDDPLLFYRVIGQFAMNGLKKNGFLFYEIHEDFAQETIDLLEDLGYSSITTHTDLQGKKRMISAQK